MIYLKRKSMKKYVVVYKRKKYIKVATAIGSKFYRILVVICLLFSCIAINAKTIRVFTGNIQRVEDCEDRWKHLLPNIERWYHVPTRG